MGDMLLADVPFNPIRNKLYAPTELIAGFDPTRPLSLEDTLDFQTYRFYVERGGAAPTDGLVSIVQALHDNSMMQAMVRLVVGRRVAAIMGGHAVHRDSAEYRAVVSIAAALAGAGILVATGGGPGAMEAAHLGALFPGQRVGAATAVDEALAALRAQPRLPSSRNLVRRDGTVDRELLAALGAWVAPAWELARRFGGPDAPVSLGIPTWHYGHEPFTPLASHVAKYFQNSVREDVLLTIAADGIVFTPGKAGTLQEIFQDAAQNFYRTVNDTFSPMVFLDQDYWTRALPVRGLIEALFKQDPKRDLVLFTDDPAEAARFIVEHKEDHLPVSERLARSGMAQAVSSAQGAQG